MQKLHYLGGMIKNDRLLFKMLS